MLKTHRIILLLILLYCWNAATAQVRNQVAFYIQAYGQVKPDANPRVIKTYEVFKRVNHVADKNNRVPQLIVINSKAEPWAIALPDGHIIISQLAIDLCFRLENKAEACLAFVLGHKLAHLANNDFWHHEVYGFLNNQTETQSLARFLKKNTSSKSKEIAADDKGFVYAALAGYDVPLLLSERQGHQNFFEHWVKQSSSKVVNTHDSNQQRALLLKQRLKAIQKKRVFFDFGVRLSQFDYCDDAVYFLREFLSVFPGREVMNNLGYCYLQMARKEMQADYAFLYWMPLLLDIETRANVISRNTQSGIKSLKQVATDNSSGYLKQAVEYLQRAVQADPAYLPTHLNLAVAYLYQGRPHQARAVLAEALKAHPEDVQLLMLDALSIYEQSDAGLDLWPAAVAKLEKLSLNPSAPLIVHYNLAQLLSLRPRLPQASQIWNKITPDRVSMPSVIKTIVCREQSLLSTIECLQLPPDTHTSASLWQWPLPHNGFVKIDQNFRDQYLSDWSSTPFDWFQEKLKGNIYRSPDGKTEVLEIDHFIQMQVIKPNIPLDLNSLKQLCQGQLLQHKTLQGVIWSCQNWAVRARNKTILEAWLIAH